ncbi:Cell death activator CIDE-B, partial [Ophiophagus hannah]
MLNDLLEKVRTALDLVGPVSLVLDEDGTSIDSEEFFQTLEEGTVLMALTEGQVWRPAKLPMIREGKGSLNKCHRDKGNSQQTVLKKGNGTRSAEMDNSQALRWTLFTMQATGHVLLGTSCYMQHLLDTPEEQKEETLTSSFPPSIALPSSLTRRMLQ